MRYLLKVTLEEEDKESRSLVYSHETPILSRNLAETRRLVAMALDDRGAELRERLWLLDTSDEAVSGGEES